MQQILGYNQLKQETFIDLLILLLAFANSHVLCVQFHVGQSAYAVFSSDIVQFFWLIFAQIQTHRVQAVALIDWIFVICLQLIERNYVKYGKKYQKCVRNERNNIGYSGKIERHFIIISKSILKPN